MNLFLSLFYREQLQKKAHPAFSHEIQVRHAKRFIRWWLSPSDIRETAQGFWLDHVRPLLFWGNKGEALLASATYTFPCPHWCHSCKMEITASCCHQMPKAAAKIRASNRNVTNRWHFKTPLVFCISFVFMLLWHKLCGCCSRPGGEDPSQAVVVEGAWSKAVSIPHTCIPGAGCIAACFVLNSIIS